jgi:ABC-2 type transport system permease protein/oleandomycin transport system permease protein
MSTATRPPVADDDVLDDMPVPYEGEGFRSAVRDARVVTRRNLLHFVRQPRLLVFSTIQPVMFVLLFAFVFGGAIGGDLPDGVGYTAFLLPGIFVQSTVFRTTQTAVGLAEDLERGVVDRFRSMPMSRSAVLVGRTLADLVRSLVVIVLMVAVGYLIGFRFTEGVLAAFGSMALVGLFGFAFSWVFVYVGLKVPGAEAAQSAGFVFVFPLVFVSSVFVPVATMPEPLAAFARISPITLTADASRALAIGTGEWVGPTLGVLGWFVAILAVFVPLSVRAYTATRD